MASPFTGPLLTVVLSILAMAQAVRVWEWRPGTPLGRLGDAPGMAALVRTVIERGPYGDNPMYGAPFSLNFGWASTVDDIHLWLISALGIVSSDAFTVMALYFFICFPLSALAMYWLCRTYDVARPAAVVLGVLFSVVPGQQERFAHLFLAAYWAVPFALFLIIETARGHRLLPSFRHFKRPIRPRTVMRDLAMVAMLIVLGLSDVYYIAFTVLVVGVVVVLRQFSGLDLREAGRLLLPVFLMLIPAAISLWFARRRAAADGVTGGMAFARSVADSDLWAGRLMDLVLPWTGHRVSFFGTLTDSYNLATETQGESAALGVVALVGVAGILGVGAAGLLTRTWGARGPLIGAMSVVAVTTFGFYTKGGLGSWFALFFTPQVRTWSRLFVFIAIIGFLGVGLWLSMVGKARGRWINWSLAVILLLFGVWDQTNPARAPDYVAQRAHLSELQKFDDSVERTLGTGCQVFVLPVVQYPEVAAESVPELVSIGLASRDLRWSFGAIKGTPQADWQLGLDTTDPQRLLDDLSAVGFCGVVVHESLADKLPGLATELPQLLGKPIASTPTGSFVGYDLREHAAELASTNGSGWLARRRQAVLHPVVVSLSGVGRVEEGGPFRVPVGPRPALVLSNMSDRPVVVALDVSLTGGRGMPQKFALKGPGVSSPVVGLNPGESGTLTAVATIPPGQFTIDIVSPDAIESLGRFQQPEKLPYITAVTARSNDPEANVGVNLPEG